MVLEIYLEAIRKSQKCNNFLGALCVSFPCLEYIMEHLIHVKVENNNTQRNWKIINEKVYIKSLTNLSILKKINTSVLNAKEKKKIISNCPEYIHASIQDQTRILVEENIINPELKDHTDDMFWLRNDLLHWNVWAINKEVSLKGVQALIGFGSNNKTEIDQDELGKVIKAAVWAHTWATDAIYKKHAQRMTSLIENWSEIYFNSNKK